MMFKAVFLSICVFVFSSCSALVPFRGMLGETYPDTWQGDIFLPPVENIPNQKMNVLPSTKKLFRRRNSFSLNSYVQYPEVRYWLSSFTIKQKKSIEKGFARGNKLQPWIADYMASKYLPIELSMVPLIESNFKNSATSYKGASGLWQFMKATAKHYGLIVSRKMDERRDPVKSTYAAATYLSYLFEMFDDWLLALAAYNAGEGRVMRAIKKSGSKDFFIIARGGYLPKETTDYVPKILAAVVIAYFPERFGFQPNIRLQRHSVGNYVRLDKRLEDVF